MVSLEPSIPVPKAANVLLPVVKPSLTSSVGSKELGTDFIEDDIFGLTEIVRKWPKIGLCTIERTALIYMSNLSKADALISHHLSIYIPAIIPYSSGVFNGVGCRPIRYGWSGLIRRL